MTTAHGRTNNDNVPDLKKKKNHSTDNSEFFMLLVICLAIA